ncbi:MAG: 50S ribosomal protein L4 [Candidatus Ryanbacteria bacterium CG10_big_fil_rev_8_21_14_0_10_43_42]|uniref:Large ribosomal subunit protein uL4 n=1 Tax=Candidatus Ryanbacteria bacterium CG10_big_fil_rev_8_21_14_0_10_43_42 TaxID=1974864 RepID=A0A2M8KY04_9BACT|nr:MAG: 50S ribosomal protein L4 [Candidatus Ryanbacteria bacterium CG10_big_fil_rev_8_21_14_0_10_43_42]
MTYMETNVYNMEGKNIGTVALPEAVFGVAWNADLVHQAVVVQRSRARQNLAHTKGRGEVSGGGKKPWRQKGTGRARHGSSRSPIWSGGGVTHGPTKDTVYAKDITKTMRKKALLMSLSAKARDGEIIVMDTLTFPEGRTKHAAQTFTALRAEKHMAHIGKKGGRVLLALPTYDAATIRSMRNIPFVGSEEARNLHAKDILACKYVVLPKESLSVLTELATKKKERSESKE